MQCVRDTNKSPSIMSNVMIDDEDMALEEHVQRQPYTLQNWLRYLSHKSGFGPAVRLPLFERALHFLPGSYKLWAAYLRERRAAVRGARPGAFVYEAANEAHDRALRALPWAPRLWEDFADFLLSQQRVSRLRKLLDRALRALPVTQHDRIWQKYFALLKLTKNPALAVAVYKRYLKLDPGARLQYVSCLLEADMKDEAAVQLTRAINDGEDGKAVKKARGEAAGGGGDADDDADKPDHQRPLWTKLCELLAKHPRDVPSLDGDRIIEAAIAASPDRCGGLHVALADRAIRLGNFQRARDVFEQALSTVRTARDFAQVWDAYVQFEDQALEQLTEATAADDADEATADRAAEDFELAVARYEHLLERQPFLLNAVRLRQSPHDVSEWHARANLHKERDDARAAAATYARALATITPSKAIGKLQSLWVAYAKLYEARDAVDAARAIFVRGADAPFHTVDEHAGLWCEFAEFELRQRQPARALALMREAVAGGGGGGGARSRLFRSTRAWALCCDLEESYGTLATTRAAYDRAMSLKVATPQMVLNFAALLRERDYHEDAFQVYERGVNLFDFPFSGPIWTTYLRAFVERYGGRRLERARDLFEQACDKAPAAQSAGFHVMYAQLEEAHGLARHAMRVYDRACKAAQDKDRLPLYLLYVARATAFFGVARTREIYESAIAELTDAEDALLMSRRYAALERRLGEIDRARAILIHAAQVADPRAQPQFWQEWHAFEVKHGNEETYAEMLRVKRSIQAQNANALDVATVAKEVAAAQAGNLPVDPARSGPLSTKSASNTRFAPTDSTSLGEGVLAGRMDTGGQTMANVDADFDEDTDDFLVQVERAAVKAQEAERRENLASVGALNVSEKPVPSAVFGGLAALAEKTKKDEAAAASKLGAKERFKQKNK